jgi:hypothetical protein
VKVRLKDVTVESGLGIANQIACDFKDGEEVDVVTSQVTAGSVELVSAENSSAKAKAAVARVAKSGAGWKSVDTTTVRGTGIVLFAGLTRLKVQLTEARHDLGADPRNSGSIVLGTNATRVSIRDFNTGQGVLTVFVRNDGGEAPAPGDGDCALSQPAVLRRSEPCLFPLGNNASVLLWWEIEKAPYRKVVLHEKLLRTTVSPPLKCPSPYGRPSGGPTPGCACGTESVAVAPWTSDPAAVRPDTGGLVVGDARRPAGIVFEANPICRGQSIQASKGWIDWGDGSPEPLGDVLQGCRRHEYDTAGTFAIRVKVSLQCHDQGVPGCPNRCEANGNITAQIR